MIILVQFYCTNLNNFTVKHQLFLDYAFHIKGLIPFHIKHYVIHGLLLFG